MMMIWYFLANTDEVSSGIQETINDGLRIITNFYSEYKSIIIQLVATLLLFLIVRFFFWNKITAVIKAKEKNEQDAFKALDDAKKERMEIQKQIQVDLDNAKQEGYQTIEKARQKAYLEAEEIIKKAKIDANMQLENAKEEIDKEVKKANDDIKNEIVEVAYLLASEIIKREIDESKYDDLVNEFISKEANNG